MAELKGKYKGGLRMAALPKGEYQRMKKIIKDRRMSGESELFQVCIRLFLEVETWGSVGYPTQGADWVARIIAECRSTELPELTQPKLSDPIGHGPIG